MRLIDGDALDKFLDAAEKEATKNRKYVLASAINTIRWNIRSFPSALPSYSYSCAGCLTPDHICGICMRNYPDYYCRGEAWEEAEKDALN